MGKNKFIDRLIDKESDLKAAMLLKDAIKHSPRSFITAKQFKIGRNTWVLLSLLFDFFEGINGLPSLRLVQWSDEFVVSTLQ